MTYGDFKDLTRRLAADKVLTDKAFNTAKDQKHDGYQRGLHSIVYNFLIKKLLVVVLNLCHKMKNYLNNFIHPILENLKSKSVFNILRQYLGC